MQKQQRPHAATTAASITSHMHVKEAGGPPQEAATAVKPVYQWLMLNSLLADNRVPL